MVCDEHLAKDVAQAVFLALAKNAGQLTKISVLSGWLHRTAQNIAAQTVRTDVRRRARENEAAIMNDLLSPESDPAWEMIAPQLDRALEELDEADRDALLLRYFEKKSAREMAQRLGISDDAAQKRVNRAVERLREFFAKRGVTVGASGLAVVISANAVQAAPVGLVFTISTAAALAGTTLATTATVTATEAIAMTILQKTIVTATIAVLAGAGIYEARQASRLRSQVQTLQQQQAPMAEQVQKLDNEKEDLAARLSNVADELSKRNGNSIELLKLRAEVTRLRTDSKELARTKATLSSLSEQQAEALKTMRESIRRDFTKQAEQQVKTLRERLSLTSEQATALKNILDSAIEPNIQYAMDTKTGEWTQDKQNQVNKLAQEQESQIMALLSPQQQAGYQQLQRERDETEGRRGADSNINNLKSELNISSEQAEAVLVALSKATMVTDESGMMHSPPPEYTGPDTTTEELQQRVEKRAQALTSVLTPEQLKLYRESELKKLVKTRDLQAQQKAMMQLLNSEDK